MFIEPAVSSWQKPRVRPHARGSSLGGRGRALTTECAASLALPHSPHDLSSYHVPSVGAGSMKNERGADTPLLFGATQPWPPLKLELGLSLCPPSLRHPSSDVKPHTVKREMKLPGEGKGPRSSWEEREAQLN